MLTFAIGETRYKYSLESQENESGQNEVANEKLERLEPNGTWKEILRREDDKCYYKNDKLPKFPRDASLIWSLREEEEVKSIHSNFGLILRRSFAGGVIEDAKLRITLQAEILASFDRKKSMLDLYHLPIPSLSAILYILQRVFPARFQMVCSQFRQIFSNVTDIEVKPASQYKLRSHIDDAPLLAIKDKGVKNWIPLEELSSGMIKVLIILTDLAKSLDESIYMIDEYENSLGINAIDFLPELIEQYPKVQFLMTSHHPYIINNINVRNWYVFSRTGSKTQIKFGEELVNRYGLSKHEAFTQLINDPFFNKGGA